MHVLLLSVCLLFWIFFFRRVSICYLQWERRNISHFYLSITIYRYFSFAGLQKPMDIIQSEMKTVSMIFDFDFEWFYGQFRFKRNVSVCVCVKQQLTCLFIHSIGQIKWIVTPQSHHFLSFLFLVVGVFLRFSNEKNLWDFVVFALIIPTVTFDFIHSFRCCLFSL